VTGSTSTGTGFTSTGCGETVTVAGFTSTGSGFTLTGCYANSFKNVVNTLMAGIALTRHE